MSQGLPAASPPKQLAAKSHTMMHWTRMGKNYTAMVSELLKTHSKLNPVYMCVPVVMCVRVGECVVMCVRVPCVWMCMHAHEREG